jgi:hypothetical protein
MGACVYVFVMLLCLRNLCLQVCILCESVTGGGWVGHEY